MRIYKIIFESYASKPVNWSNPSECFFKMTEDVKIKNLSHKDTFSKYTEQENVKYKKDESQTQGKIILVDKQIK